MKLLITFLLFTTSVLPVGIKTSRQQQVHQIVAYMQNLGWTMRNKVKFVNFTNLTYKDTEPDGPIEWEFVTDGMRYTFHYSGTDYINRPPIKPHLSIWVTKDDAHSNLETITLRDSELRGDLDAVRTWGDVDLCKANTQGCEVYQDIFDEALSGALTFMSEHPIKK